MWPYSRMRHEHNDRARCKDQGIATYACQTSFNQDYSWLSWSVYHVGHEHAVRCDSGRFFQLFLWVFSLVYVLAPSVMRLRAVLI
ncbi:hypothetical protein BR93DRAFT_754892 [Coniochaeta sp. PMI_546]|nr:hypothetical protein BR93DRAFT_754892 [Coniochaeta sp. PMI_546]